MTSHGNTGPIVPAWIREQVELGEQAWPLRVLACGAALTILFQLLLGVLLWNVEAVVCYVRP